MSSSEETASRYAQSWASPLASMREPEMADAIVALFESTRRRIRELTAPPADKSVLVVLISRRLSCVYTMLLDAGMPRLDSPNRCEVVFDRALDGDLSWRGDHVLVLDDMLAFGRTMSARVNELREALAREDGEPDPVVEPMLAAILDGAQGPEVDDLGLEQSAHEPLRITDEMNSQFSEDLSCCLYRSATPYFTDFPIVGTGPFRGQAAQLWTSTSAIDHLPKHAVNWLCADATLKPPIGVTGQCALTFIPSDDTAASIKAKLTPVAAVLAELMKIRVFTGAPDKSGKQILRIVPIGIPGPASPAKLDQAIEQIARDAGRSIGDWGQWKPQGKHRLLQMYISTAVLAEFWPSLEAAKAVTKPLSRDLLDADHVSGYFERRRVEPFLEVFDALVKQFRRADRSSDESPEQPAFAARPTSAPFELESLRLEVAEKRWKNQHRRRGRRCNVPHRPEPGQKSDIDPFWAHDLLNLWAIVVEEHQRPAQQKMTSSTGREYEMANGWYERTRCGFLPSELAEALVGSESAGDNWDNSLVSLALDIGNDLGIAVPSTHNQADHPFGGNMVYRQYRAGENALVASSRPRDLACESESEAFDNLDSFLRGALGIEADSPWTDLTDVQEREVSKLLKESRDIEELTTQGGALVGARLATVEYIDPNSGAVEVIAEGPALDDLGEWVQFPLTQISRKVAEQLNVGSQFMWYTIRKASPADGPSEDIEHEHRFEPLSESEKP